jgi:hypothetical protein
MTMLGALVLVTLECAYAQGTVTFDQPWIGTGVQYLGSYDNAGLAFGIVGQPHLGASMARIGVFLDGHPSSTSPHLEPSSTLAPSYVAFGRINTHTFGLISVDLADSVAPSLAPVDITFNGIKWDGSTVSQTFTVGGGGSTTFQTYQFNTAFALGLTRVEIPSGAWAMDNLVWIPEPNAAALFLTGWLVYAARHRRLCRKQPPWSFPSSAC